MYTPEDIGEIRKIAYRIYQERERNGIINNEKENWSDAELEYEVIKELNSKICVR